MDMERDNHVFSFESTELDLTPEFFDKLAEIPRGEPITWGATPLNPFYDGVLAQQVAVEHALYEQAQNAPANMPQTVMEYVANSFMARFNGRQMANYDNYNLALNKAAFDSQTDPRLQDILDRGRRGYNSPAELLLIRQHAAMRSVELACASVTYGHNIEQLTPMRAAIDASIDLYEGTRLTDTRYSIKGFNYLMDAFLMTRKRDVAVLPDQTNIRERSSFIVRIDEASGFDPHLADAIHDAWRTGNSFDREWQKYVRRVGHLDEVIPALLEQNNFEQIIPLSVTTYAYNKPIAALMEQQREAEKEAQWE